MHSSGMRTARLLTVSQHALAGGLSAQRDVCPAGVSHQEVSAQEGCLPKRVSAQKGVCPKGVWQTPPLWTK